MRLLLPIVILLQQKEGAGLRSTLVGVMVLLVFLSVPIGAQQKSDQTGWELNGLPAINYDSDEGFGYGILLEAYNYGEGGYAPYRFTLQPTVKFTTKGRREFTLFFDAPHLLSNQWRFDGSLRSERQIASPYYGLGNTSIYDRALQDTEGQYYYRFGRTRTQATMNLQRQVGDLPVRFLVGSGATHTNVELLPENATRTLLSQGLLGGDVPGGWSNHLRVGLVWDTRDRETGPRRGTWSEFLVQAVPDFLGSESQYVRWTLADRRYFPLGDRLTFANRFLVQGVEGSAPFYDLFIVQTSFKQEEGLGGAKTLRGIPKNRYVGKGLFLWNAELRWRAHEFAMAGKSFHLVFSGFLDSGRVWETDLKVGQILSDLQTGYGGGVRVGMGENFIVAVDVGHSVEATAPIYIGLGYLY
jgi:outer membrane protein assembly factor BamA